jgi:hypothetical protein
LLQEIFISPPENEDKFLEKLWEPILSKYWYGQKIPPLFKEVVEKYLRYLYKGAIANIRGKKNSN